MSPESKQLFIHLGIEHAGGGEKFIGMLTYWRYGENIEGDCQLVIHDHSISITRREIK